MTELERALSDIGAMRAQMARAAAFKGYGPLAFGATAVIALLAALVQSWLLGDPGSGADSYDPATFLRGYLVVWGGAGVLAAVIIGAEVMLRARRAHVGLADDMIRAAAWQMLPALATGALLTVVLLAYAPGALWMLPGLWQVLLSLGVFASRQSLPGPFMAVGVWYLATGLGCLALAQGLEAFSPWVMGLPFCIGQVLAAVLIHRGDGGGARPDVARHG